MKKEVIATENAPKAVGPYSQAIRVGQFVYTSGQIALNPATGVLVETDDADETITLQAEQVLKNLSAVLEAADSSLAQVVKTTVFLKSIKDYAAVNAVYAQFFGENPPARSAVSVAALPLGARVEIEAVALVNEETSTATAVREGVGEAIAAVEANVSYRIHEISQYLADLQTKIEKRGKKGKDVKKKEAKGKKKDKKDKKDKK